MTSLRPRTLAAGISLCICAAVLAAAAPAQQRSLKMPKPDAPVVSQSVVDPKSVDALKRMSAFLSGLKTAEVVSESSLDVVTAEGQRVQLDGITGYKIRKPGFVITYVSDLKTRSFYYDGKNFTVYAPIMGFYATVPAPPTNREVLDTIYDKFGIALPLEDLFRWNEPGFIRAEKLKSGYKLGTATIAGVKTDHYVFREEEVDWEVWIQQGDQPLPRKVVIVDRTDPTHPTFISRLTWNVNPPLNDADFTFAPNATDKPVELAVYEEVAVVEKGN
jgi:hypothetical protein